MTLHVGVFGLVVSLALASTAPAPAADAPPAGDPSRYDVVWDTPSKSAADSMPIGNGDVGLNVWVEPSGDLVFYIAKSDAMSENGEFLKLGRVRVTLDPPLPVGAGFAQHLRLREGAIDIAAPDGRAIRVWVDAGRPEIHVDARGGSPFGLRAQAELWRTAPRTVNMDPAHDHAGQIMGLREFRGGPPVTIDPDTVLPPTPGGVAWMHRNGRSFYPMVFQLEHLEPLLAKYPDPYLNRTFGCAMRGPGLVSDGDLAVRSSAPAAEQHVRITCLTEQTATPQAWRADLEKLAATDDATDPAAAWAAHAKWWHDVWDRSWIDVSGTDGAAKVASGYALQRWMMACQSRGPLPAKFNGGLFTVGKSFPDPADHTKKIDDPDWRAWGSPYWFQNTRHLYWPLIASGDDDLLQPWFDMYVHDIPLVSDKTRLYWHHGGAAFQETIFCFGLPCPADFRWGNASTQMENPNIRFYWSGGIEMTAMMLARYQRTNDAAFARATLLPFADAEMTFFNQHWPRDATGKIWFDPAGALEAFQYDVVNPLPEIAGLRYVLPQLLALSDGLTTAAQRQTWAKLLADLPPIPVGPGRDGQPVLLPAEKVGRRGNVENPELYAVYPYRLFGVGLPDYDLARRTFDQRRYKTTTCWSQNPIDAALLGVADEAADDIIKNFTNTGARFQAFWKPGYDWIPDLDNGGAAMQALQWMLMRCDGKRIQLLPAWPAGWDADFQLHAPDQTIVRASVRSGAIVDLRVTPERRRGDVVIVHPRLEGPTTGK
jgi:alpha-L-fucosidase 2